MHASNCGFCVHPYFSFPPLVPSLCGFTCGFDTPAVTAIAGSSFIPATAGTPAIAAAMGVAPAAAILATAEIPAVTAVPASAMQQYDLPGHLQPSLDKWSIAIYNAISKKGTFVKDSPQQQIIDQNYMRGYDCLYHLIAEYHPVNSTRPSMVIRKPPEQLSTIPR